MTGWYPAPTWGDIDAFCAADGWDEDRSTDHVFWEKVLPDGQVLHTHRSFSPNDQIGVDLFRMILPDQLEVSRAEFWGAIQAGSPVDRPVELDEAPPTFPAWVVDGLVRHGLSVDEIRALGPEAAEGRLYEFWSQPKS